MSTASMAEALLDLRAHGLGPRLRAEDPDAQRAGARIESLPLELLGDGEHVGRRHHDDVGPEIRMSCTCFSVCPPDIGITVQPSLSAP